MLKTISITQARKKIFKISDDIQKTGSHYALTENGISKVIMMSSDEYDSWTETLEILKDFPNIKFGMIDHFFHNLILHIVF